EGIHKTLEFFRKQQSRLPQAFGQWTFQEPSFAYSKPLGEFTRSPELGYWKEPTKPPEETSPYSPGGIFRRNCRLVSTNSTCEQTGHLLGWWAGNVDDLQDTEANYKLQYALGTGEVVATVDEGLQFGAQWVLAGVFCVVTLGLWDRCFEAAEEIA